MLKKDDVVEGIVERVEHYGIYLTHGTDNILVLIPEVSWEPIRDLSAVYKIGDNVSVKVMGYNEKDCLHSGSIKWLSPEKNPYKIIKESSVEKYVGIVKGVYESDREVSVALKNHAWGDVAFDGFAETLMPGDKVLVKVEHVDVENLRLRLSIVKRLY